MYGSTWVQVTFSQLFWKPRCRKPISGSARTMVSPSSSTFMRTVPCMAGCEGPLLTTIRLVCISVASSFSRA